MSRLRLILGDQLNPCHPWFARVEPDVCYVMMEIRQETDYVLHHAQKIIAIFAAMREFAGQRRAEGHRIHYLRIGDVDNRQSLTANLDALIAQEAVRHFAWQSVDEWRLDRQLRDYAAGLAIEHEEVDSAHFYTRRHEAAAFFSGKTRWLMENFYRHMRQRHGVLMSGNGQPVGGQWNFDHDNRQPWPGLPREPADGRPRHDHRALWQEIQAAGVASFGEPDAAHFKWPVNRAQALAQLDDFVHQALPHFGAYQDALSYRATRLFHSLLSFALNIKLLDPRQVVSRVEAAWAAGQVPLPAAEGFIRQILGWREYVRGVYWARMPDCAEDNFFAHRRALPAWFWNGQTNMRCLGHSLGQSLDTAYAHHIQRLMVIGNFALLAGLDPAEVHRWYLGVYIDAFEWVELPNTLGMSQYADGGRLATKPYVASAAYIHRMSDYCSGCPYDRKARLGAKACPFNALYWDFFQRNRERLAKNPRLALVYRQLDRLSAAEVEAIAEQVRSLGDLSTL